MLCICDNFSWLIEHSRDTSLEYKLPELIQMPLVRCPNFHHSQSLTSAFRFVSTDSASPPRTAWVAELVAASRRSLWMAHGLSRIRASARLQSDLAPVTLRQLCVCRNIIGTVIIIVQSWCLVAVPNQAAALARSRILLAFVSKRYNAGLQCANAFPAAVTALSACRSIAVVREANRAASGWQHPLTTPVLWRGYLASQESSAWPVRQDVSDSVLGAHSVLYCCSGEHAPSLAPAYYHQYSLRTNHMPHSDSAVRSWSHAARSGVVHLLVFLHRSALLEVRLSGSADNSQIASRCIPNAAPHLGQKRILAAITAAVIFPLSAAEVTVHYASDNYTDWSA